MSKPTEDQKQQSLEKLKELGSDLIDVITKHEPSTFELTGALATAFFTVLAAQREYQSGIDIPAHAALFEEMVVKANETFKVTTSENTDYELQFKTK